MLEPAADPALAKDELKPPAPGPEPLTWPEREAPPPAKSGPSSVVRKVSVVPENLPPALRGAIPAKSSPDDNSTVPAAHLLAPQPSAGPGAPPADPPTAPTRREPPVESRPSASPKSRASEPATSRRKRPQSEARRSAAPKPPPAAPGAPPSRMHESRAMPASAIPPVAPAKPPPAPAKPPPAPEAKARAEESSGTLAGFVSATRRLLDRWTSAPPEVRITLPQGDLKLFKLSGELDDRLALQAATWMLFVQAMKPDSDLTIAIDCTGGSLTAGLSLIDVLLKAKCRVRTHCTRQALGISSMILAAGNKGFRTVVRTAILTVPVPMQGSDGKTVSPSHPKALQAFSAATGRTASQVEKEILKLKSITPKLAVKHGLADAVAV